MFLLVIVGPVYCIFQLQMEFAQENVFCTEIYSDTQLMQKYRDISLKGGFLPHATLVSDIVDLIKYMKWFEDASTIR